MAIEVLGHTHERVEPQQINLGAKEGELFGSRHVRKCAACGGGVGIGRFPWA